MRLIDADTLWGELGILYYQNNGKVTWNDALMEIKTAPTIEPERKKGRWVFVRKVSPVYNYQGVKLWGNEYRCSCCGYRDMAIENFKFCAFCPNCGIEMEVE